jgi:hypothetical protein
VINLKIDSSQSALEVILLLFLFVIQAFPKDQFLIQFSSTFIHHQSLPFALPLGFLSNNTLMTLNFSLLYLLPVYLLNFQNSLFASPPYNIGSLITVLHSMPTNLSLSFLVQVNDLILTAPPYLSTLLTQLCLLPTM